jgi:hypothetical protein
VSKDHGCQVGQEVTRDLTIKGGCPHHPDGASLRQHNLRGHAKSNKRFRNQYISNAAPMISPLIPRRPNAASLTHRDPVIREVDNGGTSPHKVREANGGMPAPHRLRSESPDRMRVTRDEHPDGTRVTRDEDPDGTRVTRHL